MDDDTIVFLRALCAKAKEVATLCDTYLEQQSKKNKKAPSLPSDDPEHPGNRFIPLTEWGKYHSWPTIGGLRSMIFTSYTSGADYFIRRAGRRLLISEKAFFEWVNMTQEQRVKASSEATRWKEKYGRK
jgi:hypothetical protein